MDKKEREQILLSCHATPTSGHLGTEKTLARVTERFMWPGVTKEVYAMVGVYSLNTYSIYVLIHVGGKVKLQSCTGIFICLNFVD